MLGGGVVGGEGAQLRWLPLYPGDALRRVFEALAGGVLLPDPPGSWTLREGAMMDAARDLSNQEREEYEQLPARPQDDRLRQITRCWGSNRCRRPSGGGARKRRRDSSTNGKGRRQRRRRIKGGVIADVQSYICVQ